MNKSGFLIPIPFIALIILIAVTLIIGGLAIIWQLGLYVGGGYFLGYAFSAITGRKKNNLGKLLKKS